MGRGGAVLRPAAEAVGQLARAWAWQGGAFLVTGLSRTEKRRRGALFCGYGI